MSPQEALHRCFDEMDAANGYEGRVMEANRLTALLKRTLLVAMFDVRFPS